MFEVHIIMNIIYTLEQIKKNIFLNVFYEYNINIFIKTLYCLIIYFFVRLIIKHI